MFPSLPGSPVVKFSRNGANLHLIKGDLHLSNITVYHRDHEYHPADSNGQAVSTNIFITAAEKSDLITKVQ